MSFPFLEKKENTVYFKGDKLEIYIPKIYFEDEITEELGMKVSTMAIFYFKYYKSVDSASHKTYQMNLPENITFSYTDKFETKEKLKIKGVNTEEDSYKVYVLYANDIFIENTAMVMLPKNTEAFVKMHHTARIPNDVKYSELLGLYIENMFSNDSNLLVPSTVLELQIGELARYKGNINVPFRRAINHSKVGELDYVPVSIKDLAYINSTFTGITSEYMDKAITSAVAKSRTDGVERETPIEPVIKY
jgi:hypothetical protein